MILFQSEQIQQVEEEVMNFINTNSDFLYIDKTKTHFELDQMISIANKFADDKCREIGLDDRLNLNFSLRPNKSKFEWFYGWIVEV